MDGAMVRPGGNGPPNVFFKYIIIYICVLILAILFYKINFLPP